MCCLFSASGCGRITPPPAPRDPDLVIQLRWIKSYSDESRSKANMGLLWALSFLGARLPADAAAVSWDGRRVTLDLDAAAVAESSKPAWRKLLHRLRSSDEYRVMGGIDIGRFIYLSLCSSYQYYALTGVSPTYAQFRAKHEFQPRQVAIVESAVAHGNRLIECAKAGGIESVAFVAFEGEGSLRDHSFQKTDIETLDVMENGQLRFALYDLEGHLKATTTPALTAAGKPSKCLWCHEINLQPPFKNVTDVDGYFGTKQFRERIASDMRVIGKYRRTLESQVNFAGLQDHSHAEALYMSFAEPTAARLADEWNMSLERVKQLLAGRNLKTHPHSARLDDAILGDDLYDRNDVDSLAPYATIRGPSDMREASSYEPNLLQ
ncbi:MAG: hypothetical protein QOI59_488 [Gammaproteobacteria bacterium]|nr:hypothetical protein [Gammaproteobacteria bacterium]